MKPIPTKLKKAAIKKIKAQSDLGAGQQGPAPKRLKVLAPEPLAQEAPSAPPIDLTADTPPEGARAEEMRSVEAPASGEATPAGPQTLREVSSARADRDWGEGTSGAVSPPPIQPSDRSPCRESEQPGAAEESRPEPVSRFTSAAYDGRQAERLIAQIIQPNIQEELRTLGVNRFFREAYSSFVWTINSFALAREGLVEHVALCNQLQQDLEDTQARAKEAEADFAGKLKAAERGVEAANRRQQAALAQLMIAEAAVQTRDLRIADLESALQAAEDRAKKAEEEVLSSREAEKAMSLSLAEEKISAEGKAAAAVEAFKASDLFQDELAEANSDSYAQGFRYARERISRVLNLPEALGVDPSSESEGASDDEPAAEP